MRKFRHKSLDYFLARPLPTWGGNLGDIDFDNIYYYIKPTEKQASSWEELPSEIRDTWDKLGIPEAENPGTNKPITLTAVEQERGRPPLRKRRPTATRRCRSMTR
jgi:Fe-S cluster assembly scaffold protein SufB